MWDSLKLELWSHRLCSYVTIAPLLSIWSMTLWSSPISTQRFESLSPEIFFPRVFFSCCRNRTFFFTIKFWFCLYWNLYYWWVSRKVLLLLLSHQIPSEHILRLLPDLSDCLQSTNIIISYMCISFSKFLPSRDQLFKKMKGYMCIAPCLQSTNIFIYVCCVLNPNPVEISFSKKWKDKWV